VAVSTRTPTPLAHARSFDAAVAAVVPEAARRCPGLLRRLDEAGVEPAALVDVAALDRLPILGKDDLLALQQADPPFAGLVADDAPIRRIFQSPGPLYEAELDVADAWRWAPALRSAGFGPDDVVLNCFGYHLSPAGAMFEQACLALGARVVPAGIGSMDLQAQACVDLGVTAYIGLPSYLKALLGKAEDAGLALGLARAFVTAEPLPPSLRDWLSERVPVVRQGYGTAETGNLGWESARADGLHVPADALVQICDLTTGAARYDTGEGQVTVTILRPDAPLIRFGTGDLSAWAEPAEDEPEATPRIRGWLGRVGDAVKVRGMFLHPRQVDAVLGRLDGVAAHRFVIERSDHRDALRCEVVPDGAGDRDTLATAVAAAVRDGLRFAVDVAVVDALPADAAVIDDRRTWD
jgi:phenylacetate-CoA ligase